MTIQSVNYPGCYAPRMLENHSNPQVDSIIKKAEAEMAVKQAYDKVEYLKNTLERDKGLSQAERNAFEVMLKSAQVDFANIKNQYRGVVTSSYMNM